MLLPFLHWHCNFLNELILSISKNRHLLEGCHSSGYFSSVIAVAGVTTSPLHSRVQHHCGVQATLPTSTGRGTCSNPDPSALSWEDIGLGFGFPPFLPSMLPWAWLSVPGFCVAHLQGATGELSDLHMEHVDDLGVWAGVWAGALCSLCPCRKLNPLTIVG